MSMGRPCNVLSTSAIFNSKNTLRNHLTRIRAHDMHPQNPIRLGLSQKLDEPLRVQIRLCPRIRRKHKLSNLVLDSLRLQILLRLTNPRDLRVRVDNRRDGVVVDVSVAGLDVFDGCDALFFCLVCEHGPEGDVADAFDVLLRRGELVVNDDTASVVEVDTCGFEIEAVGVWPSANGNEDNIGFQLKHALDIKLAARFADKTAYGF